MVAPPTSTTTRSPTRVGEPLGGDEHGARRGQDAAVHDLADALHAGSVRDVLLEGVVDGGARRQDVELVDARVDVVGEPHAETGAFEQLLGVVADHGVAAVHDDGPRGQLAQAPGVGQHRVVVAALHPAGEEDQVGARRLDAAQVVVAQAAGGLVLDDAAGPQSGLARRHGRHALREAVHGHAQAAGGGARGQREGGRERPGALLERRSRLVHADGHVAVGDRGGGDALPHEAGRRRRVVAQPVEGRDDGGRRAYLRHQGVDRARRRHVTSRARASSSP